MVIIYYLHDHDTQASTEVGMKDFNYCPKCGKKTLQGNPRRIECSACGFVFYFNAASAVAAIIQKDNTILLTTRAREPEKGKLDLPGGFVDHNETAQEALQREIREELNIEITHNVRVI